MTFPLIINVTVTFWDILIIAALACIQAVKKGQNHKLKRSIHGSKEFSATCSAIDSSVSVIYYSCLKSQGGRRQSHREQSNRTELLSNGLTNKADEETMQHLMA